MTDPTSWVYITSLFVSLYGAILFFWWWARVGKASSVFMYVTFIFLGEAVESLMSLNARMLHLACNSKGYETFIASWIWPGRKILTVIALAAIVVHMTWKIFHPKSENRRETD
jgi:hypothetical protein